MTEVATLLAAAQAHSRAGRADLAERTYRDALEISPGRAVILHNLAVLVAARGSHAQALALLDEALADEPGYDAAHYNRGVALDALDRTPEAVAAFTRAAALAPENYAAHRALGFLQLALGARGRALDHFARTYELRRGDDRLGLAARSLSRASRGKLVHDARQFRHLAARRRDGLRFEMLARAYDRVAAELPEGAVSLSTEQSERLGADYNTAIHVWSAPEISEPVISTLCDGDAIAQRYHEAGGVAVIDVLLSDRALASLRRFLLESTIWHDFDHIGGFVASYMEDGLACPLMLQIADELRARLGCLLSAHPLTQAWAFKGLDAAAAVAAHADDGAVSVNFWITPDDANCAPGSGGLEVCRLAPPSDFEMSGYDGDIATVSSFLGKHADETTKVPYAANRAVVFDSRLFHRSDAPEFRNDYEGHRINVTLLFGRARS